MATGGLLGWIHHEDAAAATVAALEHGRGGQAYNVVDDRPASWEEVFTAMARAFGAPSPRKLPRWVFRLVAPYVATFALIESLPDLQAAALRAALGEAPARAEDRLLVGLAVLTLLSDLAERSSLLVLLDDAQWFDTPSASALSFAARRLAHEGIVMIFAVRDGERTRAGDGLPELRLRRLDDANAARFLTERRPNLPMDARGRVIEEAEGNPLALLELSGTLAGQSQQATAVAGSPVGAAPVDGQVQRAFRDQIQLLPKATQSLLLVAAADDTGDLLRVLAAARAFQTTAEDLEPAERAGLITVDAATVTFRHPLIRAAAYHGPPFGRRLAAHAALAATCETPEQADRHAWHRSASVAEPDEDIALSSSGPRHAPRRVADTPLPPVRTSGPRR